MYTRNGLSLCTSGGATSSSLDCGGGAACSSCKLRGGVEIDVGVGGRGRFLHSSSIRRA